MRGGIAGTRRLAVAVALACVAPAIHAEVLPGQAPERLILKWATIVNNGVTVPGTSALFNSYNQPAINSSGLVVFRARGRIPTGGSGSGESLAAAEASGNVTSGVFLRNMSAMTPVTTLAKRDDPVPQPNNTFYSGALAGFTEFPSSPRIDATSSLVATRGQSRPVYTYLAADGVTETRVGTSGVYASSGASLLTGASLLGAVMEVQPDMSYALTFPYYSVPDAPSGTRFDQFPGAPSATDGSKIAFKGNFTNPADTLGYTGVYYRDLSASGGKSPTTLIASSLTTVIPNQPGSVKFGATAGPSAANGWIAFTGWDNEDAPTLGGIYRAPIAPSPTLHTLVGIGDRVPGEPETSTFRNFGEGLSMSEDGRYVAFWGTWGAEMNSTTLYCPTDGNADLVAYCNATYPAGYVASTPVHQGVFVADAQTGSVIPIAKTGSEGVTNLMYWSFSGSPPGVGGGDEGGDTSRELPRWRAASFAALAAKPGQLYGTSLAHGPIQVAFKATRYGVDGIYLRRGGAAAALDTIVETMVTPGQSIDPQAPPGSIVTAVGLERDGFRHDRLAIAVSMLYETVDTSLGWAGLYLTGVPALDTSTTADLAVAQSASPGSGNVGKDVVYTLTVTNNGPSNATSVAITDTLQAGADFVWASPGCVHGSTTVTCDVGSLAVGTSTSVKVVLRPNASGSLPNYVRVVGGQIDAVDWNNTNSAVISVNATPAGVPVQRYRLFSPVTLEHLFTTDVHEYDALGALAGTWLQEGTAGRVLDNPGSYNGVVATPYYRLYNGASRWHHWTTDANEYYTLAQFPDWNAEGVDGYILPSAATGSTRLYRLVYPHIAGLHHWTIDENEYLTLIGSYGWLGEGTPEYVIQ